MRHLLKTVSHFFFFNDTATTEIYTLSLHDALPICVHPRDDRPRGEHARFHRGLLGLFRRHPADGALPPDDFQPGAQEVQDRKSTRLNSSHANISYAVFCLKKKKNTADFTSPLRLKT